MANPFSGIITPALKKLYSNAINALLEHNSVTAVCRLIYHGKPVVCTNCNINPVTGKSANTFKLGGSIPFDQGLCPYCSGLGQKTVDTAEDIDLMLVWDYKGWVKFGFNLQTPDGHCVSLCNVSLLPKIKRSKEIILDSSIEGFERHRFVREGEPKPIDCLGDEVFIATLWKRAG